MKHSFSVLLLLCYILNFSEIHVLKRRRVGVTLMNYVRLFQKPTEKIANSFTLDLFPIGNKYTFIGVFCVL